MDHDDSFELIESPSHNDGTNKSTDDTTIQLAFTPLSWDQFHGYFNHDGQLVNDDQFRKSIFNGGCADDVRCLAWPFIFGVYQICSTRSEREKVDIENHYRYHALKIRCEMFITGWNGQESAETKIPIYQKGVHDVLTLKNYENNARIFAFSRRTELDNVFTWHRVLEKDIPRTECSHPKFNNDEMLVKMKNILTVFGFFHPDIGYVQGMNDLLTSFMVVFENEVECYWCFSNYMESVQCDFDEKGMLEKVVLVQTLLKQLEPNLYTHLYDCSVHDLVFCHRWLLISFKREFLNHEDAIRYFEIVQSHHLNLHHDLTDRLQDDQDEDKVGSVSKSQQPQIERLANSKYTYDVFACVAVIMMKRQQFLACCESTDVFRVAATVHSNLDLRSLHLKSYNLYSQYLQLIVREHSAKEKNKLFNRVSKAFKINWK